MHPDNAALGIQPWHLQWFHVKHLHIGGQGGQFILGVLALHGQPDALRGERAARPGGEIRQRRKRAAAHHVIRPRQALDPRMDAMQIGKAQRGSSLLNDDLTANLTSKEAIDGINFWLKVYKNCSPAETINYTVNDHATLFYQGKTAFDFNSGFMIGGVQTNTPEIAQYVRCAPLPRITDSDPIYSAEASHIPLVVWKNAKHPEICKAFIEYLYDTDNYVEFIHSVPVGMLPALKDIATNSDYLNDDTIKEYSDCVDVIQTAVDEGHAIGFEHGPSAQASYLTSQGVIEEMFQDIITNGTDVETAAKAAEDKLNDIFDTMIS